MVKKSIGGYQLVTYKGDHPPLHVHVYRNGRVIGRWDIENQRPMDGPLSRAVLQALAQGGYRIEKK